MKNIFISCGHNNARNWGKNENGQWVLGTARDQWAVDPINKDNTEYRWVRKVASSLEKLVIESKPTDYKITIVPENLNLDDRIKWINARSGVNDVCIELHMNSGGGTWLEVFAMAASVFAQQKASSIAVNLSSSIGLKNRWAKPDTATRFGRLGFIRDTKPLAFLIELGFIDNEFDRNVVWVRGASSLKLILWTL